MLNLIFQKLLKKKTIDRLILAVKKFIAGTTILMSVFYGTLYYALVTLASENEQVPKPLVSQTGDPTSNPGRYYLESLKNRADEIVGLTFTSHDNYQEFVFAGNKIIEPASITINDKPYVPFRLLLSSSSKDYEVELKSKKGTQIISLAGDRFEYSIFEKQQKGFLKLASVNPKFQIKNWGTVEEPQSTPSWQDIIFTNPVSTSWSVYDNYIEIKQNSNFITGEKNYNAWLKVKLGFDSSDYINSWNFGVSGQENITPADEFRIRLQTVLAGKIKHQTNDSGNLEVGIENPKSNTAEDVIDLDNLFLNPTASVSQTPSILPEATVGSIPVEPEVTQLPSATTEPSLISTPEPSLTPAASVSESGNEASPLSEEQETIPTPHFEITSTPSSESPALESIPEQTPEPITTSLPETTGNQDETTPEPSPTSLLNKFFGINIVNAEEVTEQPVEASIDPVIIPENTTNPVSEIQEPTLSETDTDETANSIIAEPILQPLIEGASSIINQVTDSLTNFAESPSISLPTLEPETVSNSEPVTIFEEPIVASSDLSEPPQKPQSIPAQIANVLNSLNLFSVTQTTISELNFGLGDEGGSNLQIDENNNILTTEVSLNSSNNGVSVILSDIGVAVYNTGIWIASGDGSKSTDFKLHFNSSYGGAIDELYLGTDFHTNKVATPQAGSGGLTLIEQDHFSQAETRSSTLEVIEQSKVRIVIDNTFRLGPEAGIAEKWSIYATGRIIKQTIFDKYKTGEERWYLNAAKTGFDLSAGYNYNQLILNTKLEPNSKDLMLVWQNPSLLTSSSFEAGETDSSYTTVAKLNRQPWTYTEYQMIDLMQEDLSMIDKTSIDERANDYRNPDNPEFTVGSFRKVNQQYFSYEMDSAGSKNHVVFKMDGSQIARFHPVFEIHEWNNPDLSAIRSYMNQKNMVENRDYIVDFRNSDPGTGILIFHFLGTVRTNSELSADGFVTFDIDPEVTPGSGILAYGGGNMQTSFVTTDATGNNLGAFASVSASTFNPFWVVNRASPVGGSQASGSDNEHLVGDLNGTGNLEMLRWNGTAWALDWTENNVGSQSLDVRAYDIAYENSGEAVAAWSQTNDTTGLIEYRVWNGISWGASTSFTVPTTNKIAWIEMASHPASGSNQNDIGLCYVTGGLNETGCAVWNGTTNTWGNAVLRESDSLNNRKSVSVFYEQSSGDLIEISGIEHTTNGGGVVLTYSSWDGSSWTATSSFSSGSGTGDSANDLSCAPAPFSLNGTTTKNKAVCLAYDGFADDVWSFIWDGSAPNNENSNTTTSTVAAGLLISGGVNWIIDTRAMGLIIINVSAGSNQVDYEYWDDTAGAWTLNQTFTHTTGTKRSFQVEPNPNQKNTATVLISDNNTNLFAYEASVSETTVTFNNLNNGNAITQDLTNVGKNQAFMMAYDLFPNPTQTHFQWLNDDAGLNSGTAAAAQDATLTGLTNGSVKRLRVEISNEGAGSKSSNFQLEFAKKGSGCTQATLSAGWNYREIHTDSVTASDAFDIQDSTNFSNGAATTASLSASDPTFVAGQGIDSASSTSAIALNGNNYTEIEYALQANTNAQSTTTYCFRLTDGGASTSFTYQRYAEVQTGTIGVSVPTYTEDFFRFYINVDNISPTDPWPTSSNDLAENATMSAHFASIASGSIMRLRTNMLVGTATLNAASQTFQLQYAEGFNCGALSGGSWASVGASTSNTIWRFGSNGSVTDGTALSSGGTLLSNSDNGARATYEEGNPSAVNPNAVTSGQRMEHDWSVQNNGAVSGAAYCFRIIRNSGTTLETYNRYPQVILGPSTDQILRHGAFFSEGVEQGYYWSGI
ncbi:MAG: hypothetical protein HYT61_00550 [Candidatus Yanofskybacteria bacterium]|nr:hypothetical protein [Candidatus Yanofskybacteria bacterium]